MFFLNSNFSIMCRFYHFASVTLCLFFCRSFAAESQVLTLRNVSKLVHEQNPDLQAARMRIKEAEARLEQSGRLSNPELEGSIQQDPDFRQNMIQVGFLQKFPLTQRLQWEKKLSANAVKVAQLEQLQVERELVFNAKKALIELLALHQRRELLTGQIQSAQELAEHLQSAAEKGEFSKFDASLAKLEAASLSLEIRNLDASEAAMHGELKSLLGMTADRLISVSGALPKADFAKELGELTPRPDLQIAALRVDAAEQEAHLQKALRYDDVEAGIVASSQRQLDEPNGYGSAGFIGISLRIPLPLWNTNQGNIKAAQLAHERTQAEAAALQREISIKAQAEKNQMREWAALVAEFDETLLPLAKQQNEATNAVYQQSQIEIQAVFRAREKLRQLSLSRLDALREFHLALLRYTAVSGAKL